MKDIKSLSKEEKIALAKQHHKRWQISGLSKIEYCRQNNLKVTTFAGWKRYLTIDKRNRMTEIPSTIAKDFSSSRSSIELKINNSVSIRIDHNFNQDLLKKVLITLGVCRED